MHTHVCTHRNEVSADQRQKESRTVEYYIVSKKSGLDL